MEEKEEVVEDQREEGKKELGEEKEVEKKERD